MMACQIITAACRYNIKIVMSLWPNLARTDERAEERIIRIIHLIYPEDSFQTTLVERLIMSHKRQILTSKLFLFIGRQAELRLNLCPDFGEDGRSIGVGSGEAMHLSAPVIIILRFGLDKRVELIHHLTATHYDNAN